jgi:hypothetical protein
MDVARLNCDESEALCVRCRFIFNTALPDLDKSRHPVIRRRHYHTVGLLRDAALVERCWVCLRVWGRVKRYAMHYDSSREIGLKYTLRLEPLTLNLRWTCEGNQYNLSIFIASVHGKYHSIVMVCISICSFPYRDHLHNPRGLVAAQVLLVHLWLTAD